METSNDWKLKSYTELLAPLCLQFERSRNSYKRYLLNHHYLHAQTLKKANDEILRLLFQRSHLIPAHLKADTLKLIDHLDVWMVQFEFTEKSLNPQHDTPFIFHRPTESIEFPKDSEQKFKDEKEKLTKELSSLEQIK